MSDESQASGLSPEAKKAIDRYKRMMANKSGESSGNDDAEAATQEDRLLRDRPPHWG